MMMALNCPCNREVMACFDKPIRCTSALGDDYPVIRASLNKYLHVNALFDTGSDISVLTSDFAPEVGIPAVAAGEKTLYAGLNSELALTGYLHKDVGVIIAGRNVRIPVLFVDTHRFSDAGIPLILGNEGLLEQLGPVMFAYKDGRRFIYFG